MGSFVFVVVVGGDGDAAIERKKATRSCVTDMTKFLRQAFLSCAKVFVVVPVVLLAWNNCNTCI